MKKLLKRKTIVCALLCAGVLLPAAAAPARAQESKIDSLIKQLDTVTKESGSVVLNLEDCLDLAIENNRDLKIKQEILNSVEGDKMIDKSRFFSHVDFITNFGRSQGSLLKSYYPSLNPKAVSSLGGLDSSSYTASSSSSSTSSTISALAAQYGISDVSSLLSMVPAEYQSLVSSMGLFRPTASTTSTTASIPEIGAETTTSGAPYRVANQTISDYQGIIDALNNIDTEQINTLMDNLDYLNSMLETSSSSVQRTTVTNDVAIRYSRRLLEWGRDSSSSVSIRENKRLAIYNYEQKLRDVIYSVRNTFFQVLLKKDQISTREKLLKEYEEKLWKQQKRFEIAKDVPRSDVLSAELDVLNEKNRINNLKSDLIKRKLELMNLISVPLGTEFDVVGDLQPFTYKLPEVVQLTKDNSFKVVYQKEELAESERTFKQLAWDYKPILSGKIGVEDQHNAVGLTLNNSNQTYGVDFGAISYLNVPNGTSSSTRTRNNYTMSVGMNWNLYDNMERKGIELKYIKKLNQTRIELEQEIESEELEARQAYQDFLAAVDKLNIQKDIVDNSSKRLEITRKLREYGKVNEYQVDSLRSTFFSDQDNYFNQQENVISAQESLRRIMGVFH